MIMITGAAGDLDLSVVNQLLSKVDAADFSVLVRGKIKATCMEQRGIKTHLGDYNDATSLRMAFQGVNKLLLISTMEANRFELHSKVIDAAVRAGVKHLVYTSTAIKDIKKSEAHCIIQSHFKTERYLQQSGLSFTILRNTMYAETIPLLIGNDALENGIYLPSGNGGVPYALRREIGEATANLLLSKGHENKIYHLTGRRAYTYKHIANTLNKIKNLKISHENINNEEYLFRLKKIAMPNSLIHLTTDTLKDIKNGRHEITSNTLDMLLGRPSKELEGMLRELYCQDKTID